MIVLLMRTDDSCVPGLNDSKRQSDNVIMLINKMRIMIIIIIGEIRVFSDEDLSDRI